ncbi:MAG: tRNA (adenosine(37)-N6)-threonylcarbamoyltransferase complex dimerization subunit type 1 TsaB [Omnitrophica bacterium RIFCSPLOWO2_12_FULL_44_17]|uniref:tRNA (Adenosine(37)-N6)-threonylcarbamoyltransferase complex dimerization subunit type 1 TsaB n=1 Tax=Candidatus Danuiimicrobium aquiferis TaxID=1801832 RepID=A0A1G1L028_9BACT|nr:MAG: tRNA (adenosine(37)-N6)-threonylcarbamoyltransferase complex dimerization subunit type 1 TsaB [Omnitrophica bacterium RIFCSPHIGHO2_02_FULL_45_28]OGW88992.1 MAG: tRNA (adenosine(37)-N6)-threonylcarbamoyltransferase complex dimerization subunit type 1 TsaB [Omnitrophica bacterium RIFCSPHIGHO2_12_FULL_44_12]OGW98503.1 MAG: tRNA (adenosine(37)-N6)-threonylcarbamoyltransferase complex dimerization subunit type 1 TsaB [Omnitrophica bacterium RIFCSPLOWO2_12_FULL_44_17]OGX05055.1 MAG: tRNA (aden
MEKIRNILAVDTSSRVLSVGISQNGESVFETNLEGTPRHSEQLIDLIQHGLETVHLKKNDLTHFVWGLGPGSFTGLRIGCAFLKGFSLGCQKPVFGVSSLDAIALGSGIISGELAVCVDARREKIYTAIYKFQNGSPEKILPESVLSFEELSKEIRPGMIVTGDSILNYHIRFRNAFADQVELMQPMFWYPKASLMIRLFETWPERTKKLTLRMMVPMYLRRSEAEEKLSEKQKR